ncbi:hypothetical protein SODALDRAFT_359867 [Sodiomyces alkalinus F11]|uniref:Uncharacterized protein n=1 Tax=Sodiomyces alkalinus (strain CBS 110278 / VKM F-3762 / F11) TaxID=1314773 RepID=A0A3N2PW72_SODAK|nr:hypothetical protein SODALDRAFT_359867 [Sodiomyces alkalinus F11]ROT38759.1 hypothetical protein SODALDRAFT_359867 [Sodiomyces alkalinus F11]
MQLLAPWDTARCVVYFVAPAGLLVCVRKWNQRQNSSSPFAHSSEPHHDTPTLQPSPVPTSNPHR